MTDVNENRLVAKVLKELSNIIYDCGVEGYAGDNDEWVFDPEMTLINLVDEIRKRAKELEES